MMARKIKELDSLVTNHVAFESIFLKFKLMSSVHYCDQRKSTQLSKIFKIPQDSQTTNCK